MVQANGHVETEATDLEAMPGVPSNWLEHAFPDPQQDKFNSLTLKHMLGPGANFKQTLARTHYLSVDEINADLQLIVQYMIYRYHRVDVEELLIYKAMMRISLERRGREEAIMWHAGVFFARVQEQARSLFNRGRGLWQRNRSRGRDDAQQPAA